MLGLHAVEVDDHEMITKQVPLLLDWDDAKIEALKSVSNLQNLHKRYVTGKSQSL